MRSLLVAIIIFSLCSSCSFSENKFKNIKNTNSSDSIDNQIIGDSLYKLVEEYSEMGYHRVGTQVDSATNDWFAKELKQRGGTVSRQAFEFDRYKSDATVTLNNKLIPSIPLYYEGIGSVQSNTPFTASCIIKEKDRTSDAANAAIAKAKKAQAEIAVIATVNKLGELAVPNRYPKIGSGLPVVLVPGRYAEELKNGTINVEFDAEIVQGISENIVAAFNNPKQIKPIIVTTPLSGWFNCAGERATGIAVALQLAEKLAEEYPVIVVGAPGHEILHHIGVESFLANNKIDASLIIHLGANVATGIKDTATGKLKLAPGVSNPNLIPDAGRAAFVRMDKTKFSAIALSLEKIELTAVLNPPHWNGEAALWSEYSTAPLMSFTGIAPIFHTPSDIPENATNAELLQEVYEAIYNSILHYMNIEP